MNTLPQGFIMGFWVRAKDKNPQSMHFTAPRTLFGVLRDRLMGLPLNGSGPLAATREKAVAHGVTEWRFDFSLSDAPGLEGLLYLFDSEDGATTYQRSCGHPWNLATLLPLLDQKLLPDVKQNQQTVSIQVMAGQGTGLVVSATTQATSIGAQTRTTLALNKMTVQMAAPGNPPRWLP